MPTESAPPRQSYHHGSLREALLEAGLELTRTGGPGALVLRDVTRRVGVSPNAAYRHFADRDSLLAAVAIRIQQGMVERMGDQLPPAPVDRAGAARAQLSAVGLGYIGFALKEPGWFEVAFAEIDGLPAAATDDGPAPLRWLVDALDRLVASGELAAEARAGAEWPCWSAVHGFALLALKGPLRSQPPELVWSSAQRTVDTIITGLLTPAA
ncbi:TetR/AcrR family transcriptional regulator [Microlunatus soli]|uniref:DNA-binding transcriptional regulator, AcrR family n=1 Tax=Microlunatus soli TaxID=630515 RepID=A0A1H1ZW45_9ACTN|nr:TetR/AcrR family transcriptional regulator [Microlunatus soli]SDT37476.1 DNA-binding transcriptional regulator, AcrR family [Microlunatus soli]